MKRLCLVLLALVLWAGCAPPGTAETEAEAFMESYAVWAGLLGIEDLSTEIQTVYEGKDSAILKMDCLLAETEGGGILSQVYLRLHVKNVSRADILTRLEALILVCRGKEADPEEVEQAKKEMERLMVMVDRKLRKESPRIYSDANWSIVLSDLAGNKVVAARPVR